MIQFSKIDAELSIYREKEVYLFGASSAGKRVKEFLEKADIEIKGVVDNDEKKVGKDFFGIKVISFSELKERISDKCIVQIASTYETEIERQLKEIPQADYILYSEFNFRILELKRYLLEKKYPELRTYIHRELLAELTNANMEAGVSYLLSDVFDDCDYVNVRISPPKTGNVTLGKATDGNILSQMHTYSYLPNEIKNFLLGKRINLLIGIRDIISQHISLLFQNASDSSYYDLDDFWINGGDVQKIFDTFYVKENEEIDCWYNFLSSHEATQSGGKVEYFFDLQVKSFWGIDLYEYPFDKEKGYSIYHINNINIMVYQLEKLDDLVQEIGEFMQQKDFVIERKNDGSNKWYSNAYKKAIKELKIDKKYFENCYSGKYMTHFYSQEDITKFRKKWENNLCQN